MRVPQLAISLSFGLPTWFSPESTLSSWVCSTSIAGRTVYDAARAAPASPRISRATRDLAPGERALFGDKDLISRQEEDVLRNVGSGDVAIVIEPEFLGAAVLQPADDLDAAFVGEGIEAAGQRERVGDAHVGHVADRPGARDLAEHVDQLRAA